MLGFVPLKMQKKKMKIEKNRFWEIYFFVKMLVKNHMNDHMIFKRNLKVWGYMIKKIYCIFKTCCKK